MGAAANMKRWMPGLMLTSMLLLLLFFWNDDLQRELDEMKAALRQHIKLSPLDTSKDLLVWSDAAPSEGMCYVIAQWKDHEDESLGKKLCHVIPQRSREGRGVCRNNLFCHIMLLHLNIHN